MKSTCKAVMQLFNAKLLMGLCVTLAATKSSAAPTQFLCPPFWVPFQESCYRIFGTTLNWKAAEESCNEYFNGFTMGHLVSLRSEAENRFVAHLWDSSTGRMTTTTHAITYWIGLTDEADEGNWIWTDNDEVATYTRWSVGEPSSGGGNENCAHHWNTDGSFLTWNDWHCNNLLFYVCELPQSSTT